MANEQHVKIVGVISFFLALGFLITSSLFLESTEHLKDRYCGFPKYRSKRDLSTREYGYGSRSSGNRDSHSHESSAPEVHPTEYGTIVTKGLSLPKNHEASHISARSGAEGNKGHSSSWRLKKFKMFYGLAITGIVLSILQILASFLGCCSNKKTGRRLSILWMFTNMIFVIALIITFALSVFYYKPCLKNGLSGGKSHREWLAFTVVVALNALISIALISFSYFTLKSKRFDYENYAVTTDNSRTDERQKLTNVYTSDVRKY